MLEKRLVYTHLFKKTTTPGTPGGLLVMLAEYGTLSLKEVLQPAIEMAKGYHKEKNTADRMKKVLLPNL